jgi:hypothetical protein
MPDAGIKNGIPPALFGISILGGASKNISTSGSPTSKINPGSPGIPVAGFVESENSSISSGGKFVAECNCSQISFYSNWMWWKCSSTWTAS